MIKVLSGVFLGAGLLAGIAFIYLRGEGGCLGRCGNGTRCDDHKCVASVVAAAPPAPAKEPRHRRTRRAGEGPAQPEQQLRPGDEKMVTQGDALGRSQHIDLSQPGDDGHELSQEDIDHTMHSGEPGILRCITDALGDAPLESGKVLVGLRVEGSGQVSKVRVEAPQLLQRNGLYRCVHGVATALRFPASGGASVVTYPFELK